MEIKKFYLEALEIPDVNRFMPKQPPQPPPQFVLAMKELEIKAAQIRLNEMELRIKDAETAAKINEMRHRCIKLRADAVKAIAQAESEEVGPQYKQYEGQMVALLEQIYDLEKLEETRKVAMPPQEGGMNANPDGAGMGGAPGVPGGAAPV